MVKERKSVPNPYKEIAENMCTVMMGFRQLYYFTASEDPDDIDPDFYEEDSYNYLVEGIKKRKYVADAMYNASLLFEEVLKTLNPDFSTGSVEEELIKKAKEMYIPDAFTDTKEGMALQAAMAAMRSLDLPPNLTVIK